MNDIKKQLENLTTAYKKLEEENLRLRNEKFKTFSNDECWIFNETDGNNLDSLTCPVVIQPQTLLKILEIAMTSNGITYDLQVKPGAICKHGIKYPNDCKDGCTLHWLQKVF